MFIAALFTIAKVWKQYYAAMKNNKMLLFATTWMEMRQYCIKWNKLDRERQMYYITVWYHLDVESKT